MTNRLLRTTCGLVLAAAGCASKPPVAPQSFSIDPPAARAAAPASDSRVLSLAWVDVAPPYAGKPFVYRVGTHGIERDPYASFAAAPGAMLTSAIRGYLLDAPFVRDIVAPGGAMPAVAAIEAEATELYADLSTTAESASVLSMQFRVLAPAAGTAPASELLRKTYGQRVALRERTAAAAAAGWNQALGDIMTAFLADLKPILDSRR